MELDRYIKRPVEVRAAQLTPSNIGLLAQVAGLIRDEEDGDSVLRIHTLEGIMTASYGDWLVQGLEDEWYPVKDSIFRASYQLVTE